MSKLTYLDRNLFSQFQSTKVSKDVWLSFFNRYRSHILLNMAQFKLNSKGYIWIKLNKEIPCYIDSIESSLRREHVSFHAQPRNKNLFRFYFRSQLSLFSTIFCFNVLPNRSVSPYTTERHIITVLNRRFFFMSHI